LKTLLLRELVDLVDFKHQWLAAVAEANALFLKLPPEEIGCLYLDAQGQAVTPGPTVPGFSLLRRHFGSVRGAWPAINERMSSTTGYLASSGPVPNSSWCPN
jgi:hypothetical protein